MQNKERIMGMYTEIFVNIDLKEHVPADILAVLRAMCDGDRESPVLANMPSRWSYMFRDGSYYTPRTWCSNLTFDKISNAWSLLAKGDIKNYDGEIEEFFNWIMPWVDGVDGDFIGYLRYEEDPLPVLVTLQRSAPTGNP